MQRLFRLSLLTIIFGVLAFTSSYAQNDVFVSGRIAPGDVRVFVKDSVYIINRDYIVGGTLVIEPGTRVVFHPQGRLIDSTGGRIIADGYAAATYNERPGYDPAVRWENGDQYADIRYFLENTSGTTVAVNRRAEPTINSAKNNYTFNVILDTENRKIIDIANPGDPTLPTNTYEALPGNPNHVIISFEQAIMFLAARLDKFEEDVNIKTRSWRRIGSDNSASMNIVNAPIRFVGQPVNRFSKEWGHIIIMPGARAAFFRNVVFDGFKKDTTVDRFGLYDESVGGANWAGINDELNTLTNGSGGAMTTFSSRTWLIDVTFENNIARHKGGALQILQAPNALPKRFNNLTALKNNVGLYPVNKNPNITDKDGTPSSINSQYRVAAIDMIDAPTQEPFAALAAGDQNWNEWSLHQGYDDARLAVYLGRVRNLTFTNNKVILSNRREEVVDGVLRYTDLYDEPAQYPQTWGNAASGGAVYIAGDANDKDRQIEIGLGVNNSVLINGSVVNLFPGGSGDRAVFSLNEVNNYQDSPNTFGSRGGAIYLGDNTSLIVAGQFNGNAANAKYFMDDEFKGTISGSYSRGGAIYTANTYSRLQVRGGPARENYNNETRFVNNIAGSGGAIFVDGNAFPMESPVIGGSDALLLTRDYGFDIVFDGNEAITSGGAITTKRQMTVNGSGGVEANSLLGYGGKYPVKFTNNTAGYAGGAIEISIPNAEPPLPRSQRLIHFVRAEFVNNNVGYTVDGDSRTAIRGGGAVYSLNGDLNLIKAVEFRANNTKNGNGGAVALINPSTSAKRFFLTDLDMPTMDNTGYVFDYDTDTFNNVFTYRRSNIPADTRMLTRFLDNKAEYDSDILESQSGSGATQVGRGVIPTSLNIYATTWINGSTGFAVGLNGLILKLTNGGDTWNYINSPSPYRLKAIQFVNETVGFIAGDRGVIMKTVDGGNSWTMLNVPTNENVNDISFVGTNLGFAVTDNGYILKTTDGGNTWSITQPGTNSLQAVYFATSNVGYAVGDRGTVLATRDGGASWDYQVLLGVTANLNDVFFRTANLGYAVGSQGTVLITNDGGASWDLVDAGVTNELNAINFATQSNGYIVGRFGTMLKTTDGAATWETVDPATNFSLTDIAFANANVGYVVGDNGLIHRYDPSDDSMERVLPSDESMMDVVRYHFGVGLPENGVGLGGGLYILDSVSIGRVGRADSISFNRVRFQNNESYTGSAIYSDNYDLKIILNRSLVNGNIAMSDIGAEQNAITGPTLHEFIQGNTKVGPVLGNFASSDLAGATLYGEIQGPLPSFTYSEKANSIYGNDSRFLIRLPDAPNTKGSLIDRTGDGLGGTDTLRGNYWGNTSANVRMILDAREDGFVGVEMTTFFVNADGGRYLPYYFKPDANDPRQQGPFEIYGSRSTTGVENFTTFTYTPVSLSNGADENTVGENSIPENQLMSGLIYDQLDKGRNIKTADYSGRRMSPIEDFAVGIPPVVRTYTQAGLPSTGKVVKRYTRNPAAAEATDEEGNLLYPSLAAVQTEYLADEDGEYYHPIGYPLYLETQINYDGAIEISNHDDRMINQTVLLVINETTGDYIRVNLNQVGEDAPYREIFRSTVEIVPDMSDRNPNTSLRRSYAGIANYGSRVALLRELYRNPYSEDKGTLLGRKYYADYRRFANVPNLFSNNILDGANNIVDFTDMPEDIQVSPNAFPTYFAGERYNAIPANVGDVIRVISRSVLWQEGPDEAFEKSIAFEVSNSTKAPVFTGNIPELENIEIPEFQNRIFVTEDRSYPWGFDLGVDRYSTLPLYGDPFSDVTGGRGRDSIITITAIDTNRYYNPNALTDPSDYSYLDYTVNYPAVIEGPLTLRPALDYWLFPVFTNADNNTNNGTAYYGANGYVQFQGIPINPFVVPGGEIVRVTASNWPPHYRTYRDMLENGASQELIDQFIETYPPYMFVGEYESDENLLARYLQQDTVNVGLEYTNEYEFEMFVVNMPPEYIGFDEPTRTVNRLDDPSEVYVTYLPSENVCGPIEKGNNDDVLVANLTDKLRFQVDINTTDEMEDNSPAAEGWDFRYGKTSYSFFELQEADADDVFVQAPGWVTEWITQYDSDNALQPLQEDFTEFGQLNVRIPRATALELLTPRIQYQDNINTDTIFTVSVNDGHGAVAVQTYNVFINVAPQLLEKDLPAAREGADYNPQLLSEAAKIDVFDYNFGQSHTFELIYSDDPRNSVPKDPCYDEAGVWSLAGLKTTPDWLKINANSGLLYGTPGVVDAPSSATITVLVTDENGLTDLRQYNINVVSVSHDPDLTAISQVECVDLGSPRTDFVTLTDLDLLRFNSNENITIQLLDYNDQPLTGFTANPSNITRANLNDDDEVIIEISTNNFNAPIRPEDGQAVIKVVAIDAQGNTATFIYKLQVSRSTDFTAPIRVSNADGSFQVLTFGTSSEPTTLVSVGDGSDGRPVGTLDSTLCEYELPPVPPSDVFDSRWSIPTTNGTYRNIFPSSIPDRNFMYVSTWQAGGETGQSSDKYPVIISWDPDDIPGRTDATRNPQGSTWWIRDITSTGSYFTARMDAPDTEIVLAPGILGRRDPNDNEKYQIVVNNNAVNGFVIFYDVASSVNTGIAATSTGLTNVNPNPVNDATKIEFALLQSASVTIDVIDNLGNVVAQIESGEFAPGTYSMDWNGTDLKGTQLPNGTYTVRMLAGSEVSSKRVVIVK